MSYKLGEYIRKNRTSSGEGLRTYADRLGVSHGYLRVLESGVTSRGQQISPAFEVLLRLAKFYDLPIYDIAIMADVEWAEEMGEKLHSDAIQKALNTLEEYGIEAELSERAGEMAYWVSIGSFSDYFSEAELINIGGKLIETPDMKIIEVAKLFDIPLADFVSHNTRLKLQAIAEYGNETKLELLLDLAQKLTVSPNLAINDVIDVFLKRVLAAYEELNINGRKNLAEYSEMLAESGRYLILEQEEEEYAELPKLAVASKKDNHSTDDSKELNKLVDYITKEDFDNQ